MKQNRNQTQSLQGLGRFGLESKIESTMRPKRISTHTHIKNTRKMSARSSNWLWLSVRTHCVLYVSISFLHLNVLFFLLIFFSSQILKCRPNICPLVAEQKEKYQIKRHEIPHTKYERLTYLANINQFLV